VQRKQRELEKHLNTKIEVTKVPATSTKPLYQLLLKKDAMRR
jgi:hypothetical protein